MNKYILIIVPILFFLGCPTMEPVITDYTPVYSKTGGDIYFISNSGDDNNSGLSESTPWKTIIHVNKFDFKQGDTLLFESGSTFRGPLYPKSGTITNWIKYSSYGAGDKPKILGSTDILNNSDKWVNYSGNIWQSIDESETYDIGSIYMNSCEIIGSKKWDIESLKSDGDFYFNNDDRKLYLFSTNKSPAEFYRDIEAAITTHVVDINNSSYVLFQGLHISMGSAHGFGGSNTESLIIKECDISYIGGGYLFTKDGINVRYGNGIEFWSNAKNNIVDSNKIWEIYDTALTNQSHTTKSIQENILYTNNTLINCGLASYELWNRPETSIMKDISFVNNISINPGHGWGSDRPDKNSFHIASYGNVAQSENLIIRNNTFYTTKTPEDADYHLFFYDEDIKNNYSNYIIDNNIWSAPSPAWYVGDKGVVTTFKEWQDINNQSQNGSTETPTDITTYDLY